MCLCAFLNRDQLSAQPRHASKVLRVDITWLQERPGSEEMAGCRLRLARVLFECNPPLRPLPCWRPGGAAGSLADISESPPNSRPQSTRMKQLWPQGRTLSGSYDSNTNLSQPSSGQKSIHFFSIWANACGHPSLSIHYFILKPMFHTSTGGIPRGKCW